MSIVNSILTTGGTVAITGGTITGTTIYTVEAAITATGTVQGDAFALATGKNVVHQVTGGAASTGVILPAAVAGETHTVCNQGSNNIIVYPATGDTINTLAANAGMTIKGAGTSGTVGYARFTAIDTTNWAASYSIPFSGATPFKASIGATGTYPTVSREDHVHPKLTLTVQAAGGTLTTADVGTTFSNEGATSISAFVLPTAAAGYWIAFWVQDADGIRVTAATGDTIRLGSSVSAAAGKIESTDIGAFVILETLNVTEWMGRSIERTWTVT